MRRIRSSFVTGLLVLVPLLATVDIVRWFFSVIDSATRQYIPKDALPFDFVGMGVLVSILVILITGTLTQNYIGTMLIASFDKLISRFPLIGGLYSGIKKFLETVFSPASEQFQGCVLVEFPKPGVYSIGFHTGLPDKSIQAKAKEKLVNVFIPLVPNPISGFYCLFPEDKVTPINLSVQDAFKIVVSMGIVGSEELVDSVTR